MRRLRHLVLVYSFFLACGPSIAVAQVNCTGVPTWDPVVLYLAANHDRVVFQGRLYEAVVDSRVAQPQPGGNTWWRDLGACGGTPPPPPPPPPQSVALAGAWTAGLTHASQAGSNRALIFTAHVEHNGTISLNSVTYGGRPMSKIIERTATSSGSVTIAYTAAFILNEAGITAANSGTFTPAFSTTPTQPAAFSSVFLVNVNQSALVGASASGASNSASATTAPLATASGDRVIVAATNGNSGSYTLNNGFVEALEVAPGSADGVAGSKQATGANETPRVTHSVVNRQSVIGFVVRGGAGGGGNNNPTFRTNPVIKPNATVNQAYSSSLAGDATDPDNDPLTFSKVSGPAWLSVAGNGGLSGTPSSTNLGLNTFSVRVADNRGGSATGTLNISVNSVADPNCNLPRRLIVGYWQNFSNGSTFFRIGQTSADFDVINVAFALPTSFADPTMQFVPESRLYASNQDFANDVAALHANGKKVVISVGGATGSLELATDQQRISFTNSMINMINTFGFDGIDIDFEGGGIGNALLRDANDDDFRNPTTPRIRNAIRALRDIRNAFPNRCFILSFAPETFFLQAGFDSYASLGQPTTRGCFIPVIHALRDITTYVHTQDYNTGTLFGLDNNIYGSATADFHVAMSEILLQGFPVGRDPNRFFPALREDQVMIGLPASPSAAGSGFTSVAGVQNALHYLISRFDFAGRNYTLQKATGAYPNFRGLMTWSVNWDAASNFEFSRNHRMFLNALP
jgi:chitinase